MLETELKRIISEEQYEKIKNEFTWESSAYQVNYYYTDKDFLLREKHITVRIRTKNNSTKLQVKNHTKSDGALQICEETERDFDDIPEVICKETAQEVTGTDCSELYLMGSAKTLRSTFMWDKNTEICLDKTTYFDITDYEIEVEYTGEIDKELIKRLKNLGVEFNQKTKGKFSRFLKEYENLSK